MKIAVYCSSRSDIERQWLDDAARLGEWIGRGGHTLVYGGVARGLMHVVAAAVRAAGGRTVGVVPVKRRALADPGDDVTISVSNLGERKDAMIRLADVFVALPGGYGTLDEAMSTLAFLNFNGDSRRLFMLSSDGIFAPLREQLRLMLEMGVMEPAILGRITFTDSLPTLLRHLDALAANS